MSRGNAIGLGDLIKSCKLNGVAVIQHVFSWLHVPVSVSGGKRTLRTDPKGHADADPLACYRLLSFFMSLLHEPIVPA